MKDYDRDRVALTFLLIMICAGVYGAFLVFKAESKFGQLKTANYVQKRVNAIDTVDMADRKMKACSPQCVTNEVDYVVGEGRLSLSVWICENKVDPQCRCTTRRSMDRLQFSLNCECALTSLCKF